MAGGGVYQSLRLAKVSSRELIQITNSGGISQASKVGPKNSVFFMQSADVRSDPSETRVLPGAKRDLVTVSIPATTTSVTSPNAATDSNPTTTDGPVSRILGSILSFGSYDNFNSNMFNTSLFTDSSTNGASIKVQNQRMEFYAANGKNAIVTTASIGTSWAGASFDIFPIAGGTDGEDGAYWVEIRESGGDYIRAGINIQTPNIFITSSSKFGNISYTGAGSTHTVLIQQETGLVKVYVDGVVVATGTAATTFDNTAYFYGQATPPSQTGSGLNSRFGIDNLQKQTASQSTEAFSTLRGNAGTNAGPATTVGDFINLTSGATNYNQFTRSAFLFDTSAIPAGASISAATLQLFVTAVKDGIGSQQLTIVGSTPASNTNLVPADFGQIATTAYSSATNLSGLTTNAYNSVALNSTGISNVTIGGITKLGLVFESDRANSAPSYTANTTSSVTGNFADAGSNQPTLTVTYSVTSPNEVNTRDLVKWIVSGAPYDTNTYMIDASGNFYRRDINGVYTLLKTIANCNGQGLAMYNNYIYYTQNTQLGRYGPLDGTPAFADNFQTGLNATTDFAPMREFTTFLAVAHGNYVAQVFGTETTNTAISAPVLIMPKGFNIRCTDQVGEFIAFGGWRGNTINAAEIGKIYLWDGTAATYNTIVEVAEGGVNAMKAVGGILYYIAGNKGNMKAYSNKDLGKLFQIPLLYADHYIEVWPGAMSSWQSLLHFGLPANTDSDNVYRGVYAFGTRDPSLFKNALTFDYIIDTGTVVTTGNTTKIGCVQGIGRDLFFSWQDGTKYGIDRVNLSFAPAQSSFVRFLRFDDDDLGKNKMANEIVIFHSPLQSGESVTLQYAINRPYLADGQTINFTSGTPNTTVGSTYTQLPIDLEFTEIDLQYTLGGQTTIPTVIEYKFNYSPGITQRSPN